MKEEKKEKKTDWDKDSDSESKASGSSKSSSRSSSQSSRSSQQSGENQIKEPTEADSVQPDQESSNLDAILKARDDLKAKQEAQEQQVTRNDKAYQQNGYDYRHNIMTLIEYKKQTVMKEAVARGVKQEHLDEFAENDTFVDFDLNNLIQRMINEKIITAENGYTDLNQILYPKGIDAVKKRRTEAELDQMKDC